jgi:hypothetical protein
VYVTVLKGRLSRTVILSLAPQDRLGISQAQMRVMAAHDEVHQATMKSMQPSMTALRQCRTLKTLLRADVTVAGRAVSMHAVVAMLCNRVVGPHQQASGVRTTLKLQNALTEAENLYELGTALFW